MVGWAGQGLGVWDGTRYQGTRLLGYQGIRVVGVMVWAMARAGSRWIS